MKACPCCGDLTINRLGDFEICETCWWEDDPFIEEDGYSAPNHMTLAEAKVNVERWGAVERRFTNLRLRQLSETDR